MGAEAPAGRRRKGRRMPWKVTGDGRGGNRAAAQTMGNYAVRGLAGAFYLQAMPETLKIQVTVADPVAAYVIWA
jgi:hypothetical protein